MLYRTILVHFNDERRATRLLDAIDNLASKSKAHLVGLYVVPPAVVVPAVDVPYGAQVYEAQRDEYRAEADRMRAIFDERTKSKPFVAEWRVVDRDFSGVGDNVIMASRCADLVVVSQTDPDWAGSASLDVPERIAIESGRPVLMIPTAGTYTEIGKRALVAWNGKREAARAVFDALPMLKLAEKVQVLWINPEDEAEDVGDVPTADICAALARHGVNVEAARSTSAGLKVGDELLSRAADFSADLIVMGCYGHSRLREFVFGGASRHIFRHMTAPVLMAH